MVPADGNAGLEPPGGNMGPVQWKLTPFCSKHQFVSVHVGDGIMTTRSGFNPRPCPTPTCPSHGLRVGRGCGSPGM